MFDTVLVANRGEIAVRVIRTLRRLGVRSVAVYSDADADALHVRVADTAVRLGPEDRTDSSAAESYLHIGRLLEAARRTGAQAVHPGYGFLAENAAFARACTEAGLAFIGPPPAAVELMGDKIRAKEAVGTAGVPVVPGSHGEGLTDAELVEAARAVGLPVLLKPSAGGGGKGMRLVRDPGALDDGRLAEEIAAARREALASFGDDTLLLERWVERPRHIEIQVLADAHGTTVHLGERECSLQRRHQKVVEEAPSVLLDPETRAAMGAAAVRAAESCGYTGAGTVEFIVPGGDPSSFYFMEMNTRLQVEHPVTELAVSVRSPEGPRRLDLVEWQVRVAAGEALPFAQDDISFSGHAVEARICAEDPARGFLPTGGRVLHLEEATGEGVRVDSGLAPGTLVGSSYDPMLAKVIAYGPDRATALRRLRAALADTVILGVTTNTGFLRRLLAHPDVVSGDLDTGLVERAVQQSAERQPSEQAASSPAGSGDHTPAGHLVGTSSQAPLPHAVLCAAALARHLDLIPAPAANDWTDPYSLPSGWRIGGQPAWTVHRLRAPGHEPVEVRVRAATAQNVPATTDTTGAWSAAAAAAGTPPVEIRIGDGPVLRARAAREGERLRISLDGVTHTFAHATDNTPPGGADGPVHWFAAEGDSWAVTPYDPVAELVREGGAAAHGGALTAPMPGTVTVVKAAVGDEVVRGQALVVMEAMKMEHVLAAPHDGVVEHLRATVGAAVAMDEVLAVVAPHGDRATGAGGDGSTAAEEAAAEAAAAGEANR